MSKKRVLGIYGSPRAGGNSDLLLDAALKGAHSAGARVDRIYIRDLKMEGCRECGGCDRTGECVVNDDMQNIYPLLYKAAAIFLASPVFFYGFPGGLKALIDRAQARWAGNKLKPGGRTPDRGAGYLLAVGATRGKNLFAGMELTARYFFNALDLKYGGGLMIREAEDRNAVQNRPEWLDQAFLLGKQAAGN
ncbi:MAG: flavodoxin family protein [Proteobacteria bacterium]|jgi:multimeric flavodoxin WrbA|nr:flavodoxin family protein [Pseudomonadota bacterium]